MVSKKPHHFIETHGHLNIMVKEQFDVPLTPDDFPRAQKILDEAYEHGITLFINVGTSLIESINCIELAKKFSAVYAAIGIHPNDCTPTWHNDVKELTKLLVNKELNKIVAIGECGLDFHYPEYNIQRQKDAFKAQIELALEHDLALIVHTRSAPQETLASLDEFRGDIKRGIIHCFSEQQDFADEVVAMGFALGIGGTITYPKNNYLRNIVQTVPLEKIVLETDAPFLPPQIIRGKKNHPLHIATVATYIAELLSVPVETVAQTTTATALSIFNLR